MAPSDAATTPQTAPQPAAGEGEPKPAAANWRSLPKRLGSAVVVAITLFGALFWSGEPWVSSVLFKGWPFAALVLILALGALHEFYVGCRKAGAQPLEYLGYGAALLFFLLATPLADSRDPRLVQFALTCVVVVSLFAEALRRRHSPIRNLAPLWLGAFYVGWLFPFCVRLRLAGSMGAALGWTLPSGWMTQVGHGAWLIIFTVVVTSSVDVGAYFTGKLLGRHKMAPTVSPSKTWEGSAGGVVLAVGLALLLGWWLRLPLTFAALAGCLIALMAQLGDLSKSAVKREIGIKDFGTLIPGHGGILDRFDSLLFTAPTVYWLLVFWTRGQF